LACNKFSWRWAHGLNLGKRIRATKDNSLFVSMCKWHCSNFCACWCSVEKRRSDLTRSPIDEWISALRESVEVQQSEFIPSVMLKWIALFEEHPKPSSCGGVDYKAIYLYLSSLSEVTSHISVFFYQNES
jgi:hypothetical protein